MTRESNNELWSILRIKDKLHYNFSPCLSACNNSLEVFVSGEKRVGVNVFIILPHVLKEFCDYTSGCQQGSESPWPVIDAFGLVSFPACSLANYPWCYYKSRLSDSDNQSECLQRLRFMLKIPLPCNIMHRETLRLDFHSCSVNNFVY